MARTDEVTLTPHLGCRGAAEAIEFYRKALGAEVEAQYTMPDGRIMHASLKVGGATFFVADVFGEGCGGDGAAGSGDGSGSSISLNLSVPDSDAWWQRAVAAGCQIVMPLEDQFWGDRYGVLRDPYGFMWSISTHVREVPAEEIDAAMKAMSDAV